VDFFELINARHSVRAFTAEPLADEHLQAIVQAANRAPSAGNRQAYDIYIVTDAGRKAGLVKAAGGQEFLAQAPVALAFCAQPARSAQRYGKRGAGLYCVQDATIACAYAQLAATALGLATVWVGAYDDDAVRAVLGVTGDMLPVAVLPIGHAAEVPADRGRRALEDLVHRLE
jgi:nitroreductase